MREEHFQSIAFSGCYAGSHDKDDLYDLCEEVGILEVVRGTDDEQDEGHNVIEAGIIDCLGRESVYTPVRRERERERERERGRERDGKK